MKKLITTKSILGIILAVLIAVSFAYAALTKSIAAVDEWAAVAKNTVREGATVDVSGCYGACLEINLAITSANTHTGTKIDVQMSSNTSGDEDWHTLTSYLGPTAASNSLAANSETLTSAESAGATVIGAASTTGYDADETRWIFILDNIVADSEMCYLVSHSANSNVVVQDGITNAHTAADILFNNVETYVVELPFSANRIRIIYDNTYDNDGANVHTYSRITKVTDI